MTLGVPKTLEAEPRARSSYIVCEPRPVLPAVIPVEAAKPRAWRGVVATVVNVGTGTVGTVAAFAGFFAGMVGPVAGLAALHNGHALVALGLATGGVAIAGALFAIAARWAPTALAMVSGGAYTPGTKHTTLTVLSGRKAD